MMPTPTPQRHVSADREVVALLQRLRRPSNDTPEASTEPLSQRHADELLARVAWSRIAEPGDWIAGEVTRILGMTAALELLIAGADARQILIRANETESAPPIDRRGIAAGLARWRPRLDQAATLDDIRAAVASGARLLTPTHRNWPTALDDLGPHAPFALWALGDPDSLSRDALAVVGARASTAYGERTTAELVETALHLGTVIVSGGAYGIDAVAHRTALALEGSTVAVLAGGIDRLYPAGNAKLLQRIAETGAVCTEMIPGAAPSRWRFLQRNRLIAALAAATLVTEAGIRSGSLNTAGHATQLGRALGAVPGPITSSTSTGCHTLIREYGAELIASSQDLAALLGAPDLGHGTERSDPRQPSTHRRVLDALPLRGSAVIDQLVRRAGLSLPETRQALSELEVLGAVIRTSSAHGAGRTRWRLAPAPKP